MNIVDKVQIALDRAIDEPISISDAGRLHRERSRLFVEHLATLLRDHFQHDNSIAVLSKHHEDNRARFGLNELLYDVLVCKTATTRSPLNKEKLTYVTAGLWAIESEFARDLREALFDFNKLVLSSADNCVLIAPIVSDTDAYLKCLSGAADEIKGNVYIIFVPHPADWAESGKQRVRGYAWQDSGWQVALG
jgi:hypothetical protein